MGQMQAAQLAAALGEPASGFSAALSSWDQETKLLRLGVGESVAAHSLQKAVIGGIADADNAGRRRLQDDNGAAAADEETDEDGGGAMLRLPSTGLLANQPESQIRFGSAATPLHITWRSTPC